MSTLEERIKTLEEIRSIMQTENVTTIQQIYERMHALQQQLAEERKRLAEQGQDIHHKPSAS